MAKIKCENCGAKYNGNFCPICSTPAPEQPQKKQPSSTTSGSNSSQAPSSKDSTTKTEKAPTAAAVSISDQELYNKNGIVVTAKKM